jgi:hypothetical protein
LPSVIENEPSREMPTSFWVTCPALRAAISRVEAAGGVKAAEAKVGPERVAEVHEAHHGRYGTRVAGVGGAEGERVGRIKCLHAFTALQLAGAIPNPVADWTVERLGRAYPRERCCTIAREGA